MERSTKRLLPGHGLWIQYDIRSRLLTRTRINTVPCMVCGTTVLLDVYSEPPLCSRKCSQIEAEQNKKVWQITDSRCIFMAERKPLKNRDTDRNKYALYPVVSLEMVNSVKKNHRKEMLFTGRQLAERRKAPFWGVGNAGHFNTNQKQKVETHSC